MSTECCVKDGRGAPACVCAHEELLSLIGKKWAVLILRLLREPGTAGYNEIFRNISGITPKAFGEKLQLLERAGFVARSVRSEQPRRVDYALTAAGKDLLASLEPLFATKAAG